MVLEFVVHVPFSHLMMLLAQENFIDIVSAVTMMKSLDLSLSLIVLLIYIFIHLVVCLTTGPNLLQSELST
jgi:hypothetical protein